MKAVYRIITAIADAIASILGMEKVFSEPVARIRKNAIKRLPPIKAVPKTNLSFSSPRTLINAGLAISTSLFYFFLLL